MALELFRIKVSIFSVFTILSQIYSTLSVTNPNTLDVGKYQIENLATLVNFRKATVLPGRRKGGAEGANAPSIFGKLHHLIHILGYVKKLATIALV